MEKLRELRAKMPIGMKDPWGDCCLNKRVLLQRALKRDSIDAVTAGERAVIEEFLEFATNVRKEKEEKNARLTQTINELTQQS